MGFRDFLGNDRWKVIVESGSLKCKVEELISIGGSEDEVTVCCRPDIHTYASGTYDELTGVINGPNKSYTLRLVNNKRGLTCSFSRGPVDAAETGSWTAEDIGIWGNDGKGRPVTANPLG